MIDKRMGILKRFKRYSAGCLGMRLTVSGLCVFSGAAVQCLHEPS